MTSTLVTDPEILRQLEEGEQQGPTIVVNGVAGDRPEAAPRAERSRLVTDPEILRQLEAAPVAPGTEGADPARAGRVNQMARDTGLPRETVEQELDALEADHKAKTAVEKAKGHPAVQRALENPATSAITQEDVDAMGLVEQTTRAWNRSVAGTRQGLSVEALRRNEETLRQLDAVEAKLAKGEPVAAADDPVGFSSMTPEMRAAYRFDITRIQKNNVDDVLERGQELKMAGPPPSSLRSLTEAESVGAWIDAVTSVEGLKGLWLLQVESAVPSLLSGGAALAGGAVGGPVGARLGLGLGSAIVDRNAVFLQTLSELLGHDVTASEETLLAALDNPEIVKEAATRAAAHSAFVGSFDALGMHIARGVAPGTNRATTFAKQSAVDAAAAGGGELAGSVAATGEADLVDALNEVAGEIGAATVLEVGGGTAGEAISRTISRLSPAARRARAAEIRAQELRAAVETSAASKARAHDPEAFRAFVADASDGGATHIDAQVFRQAAEQAGIDIATVDPELAVRVAAGAESGSDITVDLADISAKYSDTPLAPLFVDHGRHSADAMSFAEAAVFRQVEPEAFRQAAREALNEVAEESQADRERNIVTRWMRQSIARAGFTQNAAEVQAQVGAAMIATMGQRTGRTPLQMLQAWPLKIRSAAGVSSLLGDISRSRVENFRNQRAEMSRAREEASPRRGLEELRARTAASAARLREMETTTDPEAIMAAGAELAVQSAELARLEATPPAVDNLTRLEDTLTAATELAASFERDGLTGPVLVRLNEAIADYGSRAAAARAGDRSEVDLAVPASAAGTTRTLADAMVADIENLIAGLAGDQTVLAQTTGDAVATEGPHAEMIEATVLAQRAENGGAYGAFVGQGKPAGGPASTGDAPVRGIHFSHERRTTLDGRRYGTGIAGRESARVAESTDERLKSRVYFYIDNGGGVAAEPGLGVVSHEIELPTLYDLVEDPLRFGNLPPNEMESALLDNGFHGYYDRGAPGRPGVGVIIGPASHDVKAEPRSVPAWMPPPAAPVPQYRKALLTVAENEIVQSKLEELRQVAPSTTFQYGTVKASEADWAALRKALSGLGVAIPEQGFKQSVQPALPVRSAERTAAFKAWFGDSKAVDSDGNPLVVYHGTDASEDFDIFDTGNSFGAHFGTSPKAANERLHAKGKRHGTLVPNVTPSTVQQGRVIPVYLSINNPVRAKDVGNWEDSVDVALGLSSSESLPASVRSELRSLADELSDLRDEALEQDPYGDGLEEMFEGLAPDWASAWTVDRENADGLSEIKRILSSAGFDGIVYVNEVEAEGEDSFIAFEPEQIKSAIGNQGTFDPNDPSILNQPVFHGSPHIFERFDLSKIGTGEGNQAFGWGMYFAEARGTAESYRDNLSGIIRRYRVGDEIVEVRKYGSAEHMALNAFVTGQTSEEQIQQAREWNPDNTAEFDAAIERFRGKPIERLEDTREGALYSLYIPDEYAGRVLDLEGTFDEQPDAVKAALVALLPDADIGLGVRPGGASSYRELSKKLGSARAASEALQQLGIVGLRYHDLGSRGKTGGGTRNLVIWDQPLLDRISEDMNAELLQRMGLSEEARGTFNPSTMTLAFLEKANLTTFIHEMGHFGLEVLFGEAARDGAPADIVADAKTILDWFGVESLDAWNRLSFAEKTPYHEKFAEGWETYAIEGRSPSPALTKAFRAFTAWFKRAYGALTGMRVQLTPEVRAVFDRMIASEQEIQAAERDRGAVAAFDTAGDAGAPTSSWERLQALGIEATEDAVDLLTARSLKDLRWQEGFRGKTLKKLQAQSKKIRASLREQFGEQVDSQPVYQAISFLTLGETFPPLPATALAELGSAESRSHRLDRGALIELFGDGADAAWRRLPPEMVTVTSAGQHPEQIATLFGYDSADAMIQAILDADPREQVIEGMVDNAMLAEHADLSDDEAIASAVDAAIVNEARTRFVASELKAFEDAMNPRERAGVNRRGRIVTVNGLLRAAREHAEIIIGQTVIRELDRRGHMRAAQRESKLARAARIAGDLRLATKHKRNQLVHTELARETLAAQDEAKRAQAYLTKLRRSKDTRKNIAVDQREQIDAILDIVDSAGRSNVALERLQAMREWVEKQQEAGLPIGLDPDTVAELGAKHIRDYTVDDMRALVEQIKHIENLGRLKKKLLTAKDKREYNEIVDEGQASIVANAKRGPKAPQVAPESVRHAPGRWTRAFFLAHRRLSSLARTLDGYADNGWFWRTIVRPMNEAGDRETALLKFTGDRINDIFKPLKDMKGGLTGSAILVKSTGQSWTREERLALALNYGNAGNRQRVLNTYTEQQVADVFRLITREEWQAVQEIWQLVDQFWPDIAALNRRLGQDAPKKVIAEPFTVQLADGSMLDLPGGYYPLSYSPTENDRAQAFENVRDLKSIIQGSGLNPVTRRGHEKARKDKVGWKINYTLGPLERHLSDVIHDLSWREWLIDANRVLNDSRISDSIRAHYSAEFLGAIKDTVRDIATGDQQIGNALTKASQWVRGKAGAATMGFSFTTGLLQPFGIFQAIPRVGTGWILRGVKHWLGDVATLESSAKKIYAVSPMMRNRSLTMNRELREIMQQISRGKGKIATAYDGSAYWLMVKLQQFVDVPIWWGAYEKALAANPTDKALAARLADQAVIDTQGAGSIKDLTGMQRGGEINKIMTMFWSYFSATHSLIAESTGRTDFKRPGQVAAWVGDMIALTVVPVVAQQLTYHVIRTLGSDDDEPEDVEEWTEDLFLEWISFLSGNLIGVRELGGLFKGFDYSGPPSARVVAEIGSLANEAYKLATDEDADEQNIRRALKAIMTIFGWPASQFNRMWRGTEAFMDGDAGPGAILLGPPDNLNRR